VADVPAEYEATVLVRWPRREPDEAREHLEVGLDGCGPFEVLAFRQPFMDRERRARFEKLYAILRERATDEDWAERGDRTSKDLRDTLGGYADEAGVGIISAPESYFMSVTTLGNFLAVTFTMDDTEDAQVIFVRYPFNGLSGGYSWGMYL
jgi:hypothetical protein